MPSMSCRLDTHQMPINAHKLTRSKYIAACPCPLPSALCPQSLLPALAYLSSSLAHCLSLPQAQRTRHIAIFTATSAHLTLPSTALPLSPFSLSLSLSFSLSVHAEQSPMLCLCVCVNAHKSTDILSHSTCLN